MGRTYRDADYKEGGERYAGENEAVIDVMTHIGGASLERIDPASDSVPAALLPKGKKLESVKHLLDEYREQPERRRGTAELRTLNSFIAYMKRFSDEHSIVFANDNPDKPELVGVIDYHEKTYGGQPRFGEHRAVYRFPMSDEWKAWRAAAGRKMDQATFASFLEDRILDVLDPSNVGKTPTGFADKLGVSLAGPSKLMELSRGLSVRVDATVTNAVNLSTGEGQVTFDETHKSKDGGTLKVPGGFAVGIPVFRAGALYQVPVRLRYRASQGQITWIVEPHRMDRVFDDAIREDCDKVEDEAELPVLYGTPEG